MLEKNEEMIMWCGIKSFCGGGVIGISILYFIFCQPVRAAVRSNPLIIDHTTVSSYNQIPSSVYSAIKSQFRIGYGHTSHGSQIISGMRALLGRSSSDWGADSCQNFQSTVSQSQSFCTDLYYYKFQNPAFLLPSGYLSLWEPLEGASDLGDPDFTSWVNGTRSILDGANNRNFIQWAWCGQVTTATIADIDRYLTNMNALEADYPNVTFVYMTGHMPFESDGSAARANLIANNERIRNYVLTHNKILYDFADIESYDPSGNYYANATDTCQWCTTWCNAHPSDCQNLPDCAHSHGLNCMIKAKAFWVMLARLTGWNPSGVPTNTPSVTITPTRTPTVTPTPVPGDLTGDGHVTMADITAFLASFTSIFGYNPIVANYGR